MKNPANEIRITRPDEGMTDQQAIAAAVIGGPAQSAITATAYLQAPFDDCLNELTIELARQIEAVNKGDLRNVEGLLTQQAFTLNVIFNRLSQRANDQEYLDNFGMILKLALRAQSQCARTVEVLSAIKNPANVAFVKQANIAHNQQVNNGTQAGPPAGQSSVIDSDSDPQLEHTHGNYLDPGVPSGTNSATATVATLHRAKDRRRQA